MTQKHTPGPWVADFEDEDDFEGVPIKAKGRDEYVPVANVPVDFTDRDEREANARLIAAAPETKAQRDELLEALEYIVALDDMQTTAQMEQDGIDKARAAIAKAKGEAG